MMDVIVMGLMRKWLKRASVYSANMNHGELPFAIAATRATLRGMESLDAEAAQLADQLDKLINTIAVTHRGELDEEK